MRIRQMQSSDLCSCDELRRSAGWNQRPEDWAVFLRFSPTGCFVAEVNGRILGTVTTIQYEGEGKIGWIGMLIVHPESRGHGIGSQLLHRAIEFLRGEGVPSIKLDATPQGEPLYARMGFRRESQITRWFRPEGSSFKAEIPEIRSANGGDLSRIARLDEISFGANRLELLDQIRQGALRTVVGLEPGKIAAFAMLRPGANADYLGPISAPDGTAARKLVNAICTGNSPLIWDVPDLPDHGSLAQELGFKPQRTLARMALGEAPPTQISERYWGLLDPALG